MLNDDEFARFEQQVRSNALEEAAEIVEWYGFHSWITPCCYAAQAIRSIGSQTNDE